MYRAHLAWLGLMLAVSTAQAHFVYLVPEGDGTTARVVFSDSLAPDPRVPIDRIGGLRLQARDAAGKAQAVAMEKKADHYTFRVPAGEAQAVGGSCVYGIFQRGNMPPTLLVYHPKLIVGKVQPAKAWDVLPYEIVPTGPGQFVFLHSGKPVADAEVTATLPQDKQVKLKTDARGAFQVKDAGEGIYALMAGVDEPKAGEHNGKKYDGVRHYATLVYRVGKATAADTDSQPQASAGKQDGGTTPNAEATRLLADARAARANWNHFPGFTADLLLNSDGQVSRGKVTVDETGKVTLEGITDQAVAAWARRTLSSIVSHRLPSGTPSHTPCAFADQDAHHPLGRLVQVLNDEMHSSYRIRDRQIMVVNREMQDGKFSIIVQENHTTPEGKYLPASYVVHYRDATGNGLSRAEAHVQTWMRLSGFDLPHQARVVTSGKENTVREIVLSNHRLNGTTTER